MTSSVSLKLTCGRALLLTLLLPLLCYVIVYHWRVKLPRPTFVSPHKAHSVSSADRYSDILQRELCTSENAEAATIANMTDEEILQMNRTTFFRIVMKPFQTACNKMYKFGGFWYKNSCYDGGKYVCLDDFTYGSSCLLYSFGIKDDLSFEEQFYKQGCTIHAYDPGYDKKLIPQVMKPEHKIFTHSLGIAVKAGGKYTTLMAELDKNGHRNSTITYLKVDIDGDETSVLPELILSNILNQVLQLGFEFHLQTKDLYKSFMKMIRDLYRQGFRIIAWDPNLYMGTTDGFHNWFEIVFRRPGKNACY